MLYILWHPDLFLHLGPIAVRWYSVFWLLGLLAAYLYVGHLYRREGVAREKFEPLFLYCFVGILAGARLGHCVFYQADYFLTSAVGWFEMFVPVHIDRGLGLWEGLVSGHWRFTGYEGLASHGGTLGLMLAIILYCRRMKVGVWFVLDCVAIATPVTACCIRLGNLMNSEIIGRPTDVPWAFIFERVDMLPRHPGQLYEALFYALLAVVMWGVYRSDGASTVELGHQRQQGKKSDGASTVELATRSQRANTTSRVGTGFYFGLCLVAIFAFRFCIEWTKEVQEAFEQGMALNMGQLLSVPFVAIGIWCMLRAKKH